MGRRPVRSTRTIRERRGRHIYTLAALHDASGGWPRSPRSRPTRTIPAWGHQQLIAGDPRAPRPPARPAGQDRDAGVARRGGAALQRLVTGNAAVNQYMIAINDQLGYELLNPAEQSYELPVADAPG